MDQAAEGWAVLAADELVRAQPAAFRGYRYITGPTLTLCWFPADDGLAADGYGPAGSFRWLLRLTKRVATAAYYPDDKAPFAWARLLITYDAGEAGT